MTTPAIRLWYALLVTFISSLMIAGVSIQYANHVAQESERKWCRIVTTIDDGYKERQPTTAAGINQAEAIAQLRRDLGCPGR